MANDPAIANKKITPAWTNRNHLFPIFLKLEELKVLIIGAGRVGLEKLQALVQNSPAVTILIVAEKISDAVKEFARHYPGIQLEERTFEENDLRDKDFVIIAVNSKTVSRHIRNLAKEKKIWVNVADTPDLCDFYLSSIVQKGNLKIAISTNGKSPTVAKRLREILQQVLPDELDSVINHLHTIRTRLNGNFDQKVKKLNAITRILIDEDGLENIEDGSE